MRPVRKILIVTDDKAEGPVLAFVLRNQNQGPMTALYRVTLVYGADRACRTLTAGGKHFDLVIALCPLRSLARLLRVARESDPFMPRLVLIDLADPKHKIVAEAVLSRPRMVDLLELIRMLTQKNGSMYFTQGQLIQEYT
jgi:CheY-like chemotaxis protein